MRYTYPFQQYQLTLKGAQFVACPNTIIPSKLYLSINIPVAGSNFNLLDTTFASWLSVIICSHVKAEEPLKKIINHVFKNSLI